MTFSELIRRLAGSSPPDAAPADLPGTSAQPLSVTLVTPPEEPREPTVAERHAIPDGVTIATGWVVRLMLLGLFAVVLFHVLSYFSAVAVPIAVAVLITALLSPLVDLLRGWRWPPALAASVALVGMLVALGGVLTLVGVQAAAEAPTLVEKTAAGLQAALAWLEQGPFHIDSTQISGYIEQLQAWLQTKGSEIASGAASVGASIGNFLAGLVTALIAAFFFSYAGRRMWGSTTSWVVPRLYRDQVDRAAVKGWASLVSYMRATLIICFVDALGISVGAAILGTPMPVALFALTFVASFIPIVGATTAGIVAVALALVTNGPVSAVIMLAIVLGVNMVEGNLLQPFLMGKAVELHPLATVLGLTVGVTVSGILGALLVIPLMAFAAAFVKAIRDPEDLPDRPTIGRRDNTGSTRAPRRSRVKLSSR